MMCVAGNNFEETWRAYSEFLEEVGGAKFLFVVGPQRSGTTWMQTLLDAHPAVSCRFELRLHDSLLRHLHRALAEYNGSLQRHSVNTPPQIPLESRLLDQQRLMLVVRAAFLAQFFGRVGPGLRYIGEKTPENLLGISDLQLMFPEARYVVTIRDGRDCAISSWHHYRNAGSPDLPLAEFIRRWVPERWAPFAEGALALVARDPANAIVVRYEDLMGAPAATFSSLLAALDLDRRPEIVESCLAAAAFPAVSGGRAPGEEEPHHFYRSGVAGEWRRSFGPEERDAFAALGGELNARLGYRD